MQPPTDLRQVAVENLTVGRMDPVRFVEEAAAAGFGAVGLPLATATPVPLEHEVVGRPEVIRALAGALRQTGMRVLDVEAFVLSPQASLEGYRPVLEVGAELGATHISVIGAQVLGNTRFLANQQRIELFGQLCDEAAGFGLHVGVEFMIYRDIRTAAEALALVDAAGRPNAGLILDALHIHRAGTAVAELARLPPARVAWAQLCDAAAEAPALEHLPTEARTGRLHPGQGVLPLREFLACLPDGTTLTWETPVAAEAAWPTARRLQSAAEHARRFLRDAAASG